MYTLCYYLMNVIQAIGRCIMSFLEHIWEHIHNGYIQNAPYPVALNVNLAFTVMLPDRENHLFWLPYEFTGLCYRDMGTYVNILPYYKGTILEDVELSHGTDLYKPRTEAEFLKRLYRLSWSLEESVASNVRYYDPLASAADYILKMYHFIDWLRYYNSATDGRPSSYSG